MNPHSFQHFTRTATAALLALVAGSAAAFPAAEIGDAGQSLADAQVISGSGPVESISGTLGSGTDVDLYKIHVADPTQFFVSAVSNPGIDGMLFLFDASGRGVVMRDDSANVNANFGALSSAFVVTPGDYYLAISVFDITPSNADGLLFPDTRLVDSGLEYGPSGPGGALPFSTWVAASGGSQPATGDYVLTLRGVSAVPEPGMPMLLGVGLAGLMTSLRRRSPAGEKAA